MILCQNIKDSFKCVFEISPTYIYVYNEENGCNAKGNDWIVPEISYNYSTDTEYYNI